MKKVPHCRFKYHCIFICFDLTVSYFHQFWLCFWEVIVLQTSPHHHSLLFQMGQFYYAAKAFDALEKLDPGSNYWEGKRGACVGIFQLILANQESKYVFFFPLWFIITQLKTCFADFVVKSFVTEILVITE